MYESISKIRCINRTQEIKAQPEARKFIPKRQQSIWRRYLLLQTLLSFSQIQNPRFLPFQDSNLIRSRGFLCKSQQPPFSVGPYYSPASSSSSRVFASAMGSVDRADDRTFKVNLTGDSLLKLRDSVGEKLKEFMGDYTDDTLVVLSSISSSCFDFHPI